MKDAAVSSAPPDMSPGGKKLVQARLPFKVVSPLAPKPPPAARKRKLSAQPSESACKLSKENELAEELVVISDDDGEATRPPTGSEAGLVNNPYLKMVDKAIKKKLQKKTPRKRKHGKSGGKVTKESSDDKVSNKTEDDVSKTPIIEQKVTSKDDDDVVVVNEKSNESVEIPNSLCDEKKNGDQGGKVITKAKIIKVDQEVMEIDENSLENVSFDTENKKKNSKKSENLQNEHRKITLVGYDSDVNIIKKTERISSTCFADKVIKDKLQKTPHKRNQGKSRGQVTKENSEDKVSKKTDDHDLSKTSLNKQKVTSDDDDYVVIVNEKSKEAKGIPNYVCNETKNGNQVEKVTITKIIRGDQEFMKADENSLANEVSAPLCEDSNSQDKEVMINNISTVETKGDQAKSEKPKKHENENRIITLVGGKKDDDSIVNIIEKKEKQSPTRMTLRSPSKSEESPKGITTDFLTEKEDHEQLACADSNITPKRRSNRTKNTLEKLDTPTNIPVHSTKANLSSLPEVTTPKQKARKSLGSEENLSEHSSSPSTALTPKQLQRRLESAKKRDEKEREKQERENKRLQEKEERNKIKLEKEELRRKEREEREEQKKKEKEEKEDQKRKEKEEKERQKELEKKERELKEELKRKEKEEKDEQRRKEKEAKEEEKKKKLEALEEEKKQKEIEKQEQEIKKKKAAAAFVNFFVPKQKADLNEPSTSTQSQHNMLSSFMVKSDMRLAPTVRSCITCDQKNVLDSNLESQNLPKKDLYLQNLRDKVVKPRTSEKTWPLDDKDDDCMIVESEEELPPAAGSGEVVMQSRERLRPKLLSFHENRRPPYWGTWRKKSNSVSARRPFGADKQLDYEVDSESEWEEEGEGESIAGSAAGSVDEERDEYEVDNDFFVPHGYLSDEEATMDEDDVLSLSPETQKLKLKHLEDEFESEMKKPTEKLKPRLYGMLWENSEGGRPDNCVDSLWNYFGRMTMILEDPTPLLQPPPEPEKPEKKRKKTVTKGEETPGGSPKSAGKRKRSKPVKKDVPEAKKLALESLKNQPVINAFLTKLNSS